MLREAFFQESNTGIWQLNFGVSAESFSSKTRRSTQFQICCSSLIMPPSYVLEAPSEVHRCHSLSEPKPLLPLWLHLTNTLTHADPSMSVSTTQRGCGAWHEAYNSAWFLETEMLSVSVSSSNSKQVFVQSLIFLFSTAGHIRTLLWSCNPFRIRWW